MKIMAVVLAGMMGCVVTGCVSGSPLYTHRNGSPGTQHVTHTVFPFDLGAAFRQHDQQVHEMMEGWAQRAHESSLAFSRQQAQRSLPSVIQPPPRQPRRQYVQEDDTWNPYGEVLEGIFDSPTRERPDPLADWDREQERAERHLRMQYMHEERARNHALGTCATIWNNPEARAECRQSFGGQ